MEDILVVNDFKKAEETYKLTEEYLNKNKSFLTKITKLQASYQEIFSIIPETLKKIKSGHSFPYTESYNELETSLLLARMGFYRHSFYALRSMLELGILGIFYDLDDRAEIDIKNWLTSSENTPWFKEMIKKTFKKGQFKEFQLSYDLKNELEGLYSQISDWVHIKGFNYSSDKLNNSNFNRFILQSFEKYVELLEKVTIALVQMYLLQYPMGCQIVPDEVAYNLVGGFVSSYQNYIIQLIIPKERMVKLKELSDKNDSVIGTLQWVEQNKDKFPSPYGL